MGITCTWPCMALSEAKLSGPKYKVALDKLACLSLSNPAYLSSWLDALTTDHVRLKLMSRAPWNKICDRPSNMSRIGRIIWPCWHVPMAICKHPCLPRWIHIYNCRKCSILLCSFFRSRHFFCHSIIFHAIIFFFSLKFRYFHPFKGKNREKI